MTIASPLQFLLFSSIIFFSVSVSYADDHENSSHSHALVLPVYKDASTRQYLTHILQRTPLVSVKLVVDLGGQFLWVDCDQGYVSSSFIPSLCRSVQCSLARTTGCSDCFSAPRPGCNNNTCRLPSDNTITRTATGGDLGQDVVSVQSTDGYNPGANVTVQRFLFSCAPTFLLEGLANGTKGMAGLGRTRISLSSQFAFYFGLHGKFAICLAASPNATGAIFFGDGPYEMLQYMDVSTSLQYTPLIINPVSTASAFSQGEPSSEYFVGLQSIRINEKNVSLNTSLLLIDRNGTGGTKISTVNPYTVLETSIYNSFTEVFIKEAANMDITRVAAVEPFGVCFSSKNISSTRLGPSVPTIDLVLYNETMFWNHSHDSVLWKIYGANSMVQVSADVWCLGFIDGGSNPKTSVVIGGHQLEDNLLQFDLVRSRLGFSSSLLVRETACSNFNFTTKA